MKRGAVIPEKYSDLLKVLGQMDFDPSPIAKKRKNLVAAWLKMRRKGLSAAAAAEGVGVSRSSLFDWLRLYKETGSFEPGSRRPHHLRQSKRSPELEEAVRHWREYSENCWGKEKIGVKVREDDFNVSDSTVGRILTDLIKRGKLAPRRQKRRHRRKNQRRTYGIDLPKGLRPSEPGEIMQADTAFITLPGTNVRVKHIAIVDPVSKLSYFHVYWNATSRNTAEFLRRVVKDAPFPIKAIQVDRGSEFKKLFEQACQELGIKLYVLPVKRPDLNGAVERSHRTCREEFYSCWELPLNLEGINRMAEAFAWKFNHERPHRALDGLTPADNLRIRYGLNIPESSGMY